VPRVRVRVRIRGRVRVRVRFRVRVRVRVSGTRTSGASDEVYLARVGLLEGVLAVGLVLAVVVVLLE